MGKAGQEIGKYGYLGGESWDEIRLCFAKTIILYSITANAGIPTQWASKELLTSPCNKKAIECPRPQPGHQVMPINLNGHKV